MGAIGASLAAGQPSPGIVPVQQLSHCDPCLLGVSNAAAAQGREPLLHPLEPPLQLSALGLWHENNRSDTWRRRRGRIFILIFLLFPLLPPRILLLLFLDFLKPVRLAQ